MLQDPTFWDSKPRLDSKIHEEPRSSLTRFMSFENSVSLSKVCFLLFRLRPGTHLMGYDD